MWTGFCAMAVWFHHRIQVRNNLENTRGVPENCSCQGECWCGESSWFCIFLSWRFCFSNNLRMVQPTTTHVQSQYQIRIEVIVILLWGNGIMNYMKFYCWHLQIGHHCFISQVLAFGGTHSQRTYQQWRKEPYGLHWDIPRWYSTEDVVTTITSKVHMVLWQHDNLHWSSLLGTKWFGYSDSQGM